MSKNSSVYGISEPERQAWARAELEQDREFKRLPLRDKWKAAADAGELMLLIERSTQKRKAEPPDER